MSDPRKVFVVHGRNDAARKAVFDLLRALNLWPLEWNEVAAETDSGSPFIFEILQKGFEIAQAIVVVLTPDEIVQLRPELQREDEDKASRYQPRPNVLFEAGMAFMRDRSRTILLEFGPMIQASDLSGVHAIRVRHGEGPATRKQLADRLVAAGCAVSIAGQDWLGAGDFDVALNPPLGDFDVALNPPLVTIEGPSVAPLGKTTYFTVLSQNAVRGEWSVGGFLSNELFLVEPLGPSHQIFISPTDAKRAGDSFTIVFIAYSRDGKLAKAEKRFSVSGPIDGDPASAPSEHVIYDGTKGMNGFHFKGQGERFFGEDESKPEGQGGLDIESDLIQIRRHNTAGRYRVILLKYSYLSQELDYLPRNNRIDGDRKLKVSCEVRVLRGPQKLGFSIKRREDGGLLRRTDFEIIGLEWKSIVKYMLIDPAFDVRLWLENQEVSSAGSAMLIRKLTLIEA